MVGVCVATKPSRQTASFSHEFFFVSDPLDGPVYRHFVTSLRAQNRCTHRAPARYISPTTATLPSRRCPVQNSYPASFFRLQGATLTKAMVSMNDMFDYGQVSLLGKGCDRLTILSTRRSVERLRGEPHPTCGSCGCLTRLFVTRYLRDRDFHNTK